MKDLLNQLDKILENRVRLGIMSLLVVDEAVGFNTLKQQMGLTDGNLASHILKLEKEKYLSVHKKFVEKKPHTSYKATDKGRKAFLTHLNALEALIKEMGDI